MRPQRNVSRGNRRLVALCRSTVKVAKEIRNRDLYIVKPLCIFHKGQTDFHPLWLLGSTPNGGQICSLIQGQQRGCREPFPGTRVTHLLEINKPLQRVRYNLGPLAMIAYLTKSSIMPTCAFQKMPLVPEITPEFGIAIRLRFRAVVRSKTVISR